MIMWQIDGKSFRPNDSILQSVLAGSIVSFIALAWICFKAQVAQMHGEIRYPKMPVSVEGCDYSFDNATVWEAIHAYR